MINNALECTPQIKVETDCSLNPDIFFDGDDDCVTIVISSEDESMEEDEITLEDTFTKCKPDIKIEDYDRLNCPLYVDGSNLELLSPMQPSPVCNSQSPCLSYNDPTSPASTLLSDFGYESVESPLSDMNDFQDLWNESINELFPSLV